MSLPIATILTFARLLIDILQALEKLVDSTLRLQQAFSSSSSTDQVSNVGSDLYESKLTRQ